MSESINNHTPRAVDGNSAVAEDINQPLRQLDFAIGKHNMTATANPTTAANAAAGYTTGRSFWFNTANGSWWLCVNAAAGTWQQISLGGAVAGHTHAATDIISGLLSLLVGGTGADLSASGPGVVVQASNGAALTSRALQAGDLPAASTTSQGAVELATNTEAINGVDAARAITPAALAAVLADALDDVAADSTFITTSTGPTDANKKIKLDSDGKLDFSMLDYNDVWSIILSRLSAQGDILVRNNAGALQRKPAGGQGQVLSVDFNDPTGLAYVPQVTSGSGVPMSTIDAKGDLLVGTAPDTIARLPVGANGRLLAASSSAPEGLTWVDGANLQLIAETATPAPWPFSLDVPFGIFSTYKKLILIGEIDASYNGFDDVTMRVNGATTGYLWNSLLNNGSTLVASQALAASGTAFPLALGIDLEGGVIITFQIEIFYKIQTTPTGIILRGDIEEKFGTSSFKSRQLRGQFLTESLNQISFICPTIVGNLKGRVRLYGLY